MAKEVVDRAGEGTANGNLGNAYWALGASAKAIDYHTQCLLIAKEVGDLAGKGIAYASLGCANDSMSQRNPFPFYESKRSEVEVGFEGSDTTVLDLGFHK